MRKTKELNGHYFKEQSWQVQAILLLLGWMIPVLFVGEGRASTSERLSTDQTILRLEEELAKQPESAPLKNRLAWSYIQKGRETGESAYFTRAERLLEKSLAQAASNAEALGLRAWVALFKHEFKEAAVWAEKASIAQPKSSFHYGVLSDAFLEMGDYPKAIDYAQKMVDLKPDQGAYSRAAHLRMLHGDSEGAIALWESAVRAGSPIPENTAWCRVELGEVYFNIGKLKEAEGAYQSALKLVPRYHRALAGLARIRAIQKGPMENGPGEAIRLYEQAIDQIPYPHYIAALGDLYTAIGKPEEAQKQYALVEHIAKLDRVNQVLYDRDLALFYADHGRNLDEAVRIAERELERRRDLYTYDILGWVYYRSNRYPEAEQAIAKAISLGTQDPRILFHAGMIAHAVGKEKEAKRLLNRALALNPRFHPLYAPSARSLLRTIG
jgi:tetratricopeptide (TPR) repeat protein